jgi:hypothetical protein
MPKLERHQTNDPIFIDRENRIYFNANLKSTEENQIATYDFRSNVPLLIEPEKYFLSVLRFNFPSHSIPFMIYPKDEVLRITFASNSAQVSHILVYFPYSTNLSTSDPRYYYMYSAQHFIEIINVALKQCFDDLLIADPTISATEEPYFYLDKSDNKMKLFCERLGYDETAGGVVSRIFFNKALSKYINYFNILINYTSDNLYMRLLPAWNKVNNRVDGDLAIDNTAGAYIIEAPEYPNIKSWAAFNGVSIRSTLPTVNELSKVEGLPLSIQNEQIITDFLADFVNPHETRDGILYFNVDEKRLIDFTTQERITNLSFTINWINKDMENIPILLNKNEVMNIKFAFIRKNEFAV